MKFNQQKVHSDVHIFVWKYLLIKKMTWTSLVLLQNILQSWCLIYSKTKNDALLRLDSYSSFARKLLIKWYIEREIDLSDIGLDCAEVNF